MNQLIGFINPMKTYDVLLGIIPEAILKEYLFCNLISEIQQEKELSNILQPNLSQEELEKIVTGGFNTHKILLWCLILSQHTSLAVQDLGALANKLNISNQDKIRFAFIFGRLDFATTEYFTFNYELNKDMYYIFKNSVSSGNLVALQ
jgi:hypothetical protein